MSIQDLSTEEKKRFNGFVQKGRAFHAEHDYKNALDQFQSAHAIYPEQSIQRRIYQLQILLNKAPSTEAAGLFSPIQVAKKSRPTSAFRHGQDVAANHTNHSSSLQNEITTTTVPRNPSQVRQSTYTLDISSPVTVSQAIADKLSFHGFHGPISREKDFDNEDNCTDCGLDDVEPSRTLPKKASNKNKKPNMEKKVGVCISPERHKPTAMPFESQHCMHLQFSLDETRDSATLLGNFPLPSKLYSQLHPHQKEGVAWMWSLHPSFQSWYKANYDSRQERRQGLSIAPSDSDSVSQKDSRTVDLGAGGIDSAITNGFRVPEFSGGILADDMGLGKT